MRRDALRLRDIAEAARVVATYLEGVGQRQFLAGGLAHDAIVRQLIVVGEAAFKVSRELQARHPQIPWQQIAGFRHRLVHDYFGLDLDAVWHIASVELPRLQAQILAILESETHQESDAPQD